MGIKLLQTLLLVVVVLHWMTMIKDSNRACACMSSQQEAKQQQQQQQEEEYLDALRRFVEANFVDHYDERYQRSVPGTGEYLQEVAALQGAPICYDPRHHQMDRIDGDDLTTGVLAPEHQHSEAACKIYGKDQIVCSAPGDAAILL